MLYSHVVILCLLLCPHYYYNITCYIPSDSTIYTFCH